VLSFYAPNHLSYPSRSIGDPNMHTENRTRAAGTVLGATIVDVAMANSTLFSTRLSIQHIQRQIRGPCGASTDDSVMYKARILSNTKVISVAAQTPWYRLTQYDIPADLPACSDCICAWAWIPNGCGTPNAVRESSS